MSMKCEDVRPLIAALVYEELDEADATAVQEHLEGCVSCRQRLFAYGEVRKDLREWQPAAAPAGITFIGMPPAQSASGGSWWLRGLAVAASFILGLMLTAAFVNLEINSTPGGWTVSTSLWGRQQAVPVAAEPGTQPRTQPETQPAARPFEPSANLADSPAQLRPVSLLELDQEELNTWFDRRFDGRFDTQLGSRGGTPASGTAATNRLTDEQRDQLESILADRFALEGGQQTQIFQDLLAVSESRQRQEFFATLAGLYESLEAERRDALMIMASEFGLAQADTGQRLDLANARIEYLLTQVGSRSPEREPEQ